MPFASTKLKYSEEVSAPLTTSLTIEVPADTAPILSAVIVTFPEFPLMLETYCTLAGKAWTSFALKVTSAFNAFPFILR